jgi:hypothetical protein
VTVRGIHGGYEFESIERLASGVHFLEDDANGFLGRAGLFNAVN